MNNSIASSAVLIDLNISVWTARKLDKNVSKEIDINKGATTQAGNYNKHILAGADELERITKLATEIRDWHTRQTLPWSDAGTRLLPMANFFEYKDQMADYEEVFKERVDSFIKNYPNIITSLFDRNDYPDADIIANRFKLKYTIMPVPEVGDFRVDVEQGMKEKLEQEYKNAYDERVNNAMNDAWSRLHQTMARMVERLSGNDKKIFRNSLVDNALELTGLLTKLNVTKDPKLEQARIGLEKSLMGVSPEDLRQHADLRQDVLARVNSIMENI
jgi:hypothetical protein